MNELMMFDQRDVLGRDFKIYGNADQPLFKADDVANWIEHSNVSVMLNSVDADEKQLMSVGTLNNSYSAWFLTEDGLYEVLMQSRKRIAKEFKKQVKEILKTIRKHGGYLTANTIEEVLSNPDTLIRLATDLKHEREERTKAEALIEAQKPKVLFAESVMASDKSILMNELAKIICQNGYDIGQNRLYGWMVNNGYLFYRDGGYLPSQRAMDLKVFEIKKTTIELPDREPIVRNTIKITPKGQIYFVNKFLARKEAV